MLFQKTDKIGDFQLTIGKKWQRMDTNGGEIDLKCCPIIFMLSELIMFWVFSEFGKFQELALEVYWELYLLFYFYLYLLFINIYNYFYFYFYFYLFLFLFYFLKKLVSSCNPNRKMGI